MIKISAVRLFTVALILLQVPYGAAVTLRYDFESGTTAVDTGGGGFDSSLVGTGMAVANSGAKFGSGSLRTDGNSIANYTQILDLTGSKAPLNTAVTNVSFSIFIRPDSATIGQQLTLFTHRAAVSAMAGQYSLLLRTDGKLQFQAYAADGAPGYFAPISTVAVSLTANQYTQLGVTYDATLDQVIYYANGVKLGSTMAVANFAAIPAISSVPTTAYLRFAMDPALAAVGINYDNIIYDTGSTYSADDMLTIYNTGVLRPTAKLNLMIFQ